VKLSRRRLTGLLAVVALAAGCGSDESGEESQQLPRDLGDELAQQSDDVERTLAAGKSCDAQRQALRLQATVESSIAQERVPPELQDELRRRAADLVDSIDCRPPPPPPPPAPQTTQTRTDDGEEEDD
jgi:hypothetical protein